MIPRCLMFAGLLLTASGGGAWAECTLGAASVTGGAVSGRYDGLANADTVIRAPVRLSASPDCRDQPVTLAIIPEGMDRGAPARTVVLRHGAQMLQVEIRIADPAMAEARRSPGDDGVSRDVVVGGTGDLLDSTLILTAPSGQSVSPGVYAATISLAAITGQGRAAPPGPPIEISMTVEPTLALAAGAGLVLDLGELKPRGRAANGVSFRAYANTPYRIAIISDNGWTLRKEGGSGAIGYQALLEGQTLTPFADGTAPAPGAMAVGRDFDRPGDRSQLHIFNAQVYDFARVPAGVYSDAVTIRISPM